MIIFRTTTQQFCPTRSWARYIQLIPLECKDPGCPQMEARRMGQGGQDICWNRKRVLWDNKGPQCTCKEIVKVNARVTIFFIRTY
jgi:hypothetical protein